MVYIQMALGLLTGQRCTWRQQGLCEYRVPCFVLSIQCHHRLESFSRRKVRCWCWAEKLDSAGIRERPINCALATGLLRLAIHARPESRKDSTANHAGRTRSYTTWGSSINHARQTGSPNLLSKVDLLAAQARHRPGV